ncbi:conjugal transfer protein TraF [Succinivibrio dextrinosolvens]|jgi:conjugal transfer pilus assembly protein TraF|uniref:conjugal transfer protein TraF n=1 Tax=Succinivibrio dextrinosolvens TaxID=83771 RepID=UPI00241D9BB3|nr:conjugal transfer protein TraF [Succinivibrio dextrinosolvens]MBE6423126.1 hypothetical protein [Succinivibrio dextrinosolvens]
MKNFTKTIIALATMCILAPSYATHSNNNSGSFWEDKAEGWYWYTKQPEVAKKKPKKKEEPKVVIAETKKEPEKKDVKQEAPEAFSADWIKENLEVYKKLAWNEPTVENLRAYMYLQRFAMDRSEQFAYAGQMAVQGDPFLDEAARAPTGGNMFKTRGYLINGEQNYVLKKLFKKVGVFFVFRNDCYMCDEQAKVLKMAQKEFKTEITAVSLDEPNEKCNAAKIFPDYIVNPDIIQTLKVRALPATFFVNPENGTEIKPLIQGFATLNDFNRRSLNSAQKYNWLSQEDFNLIKPVDDITSLSSLLTTESNIAKRVPKEKEDKNPFGKDTNFVAPKKLVKMIQEEREKHIPADFMPRGY